MNRQSNFYHRLARWGLGLLGGLLILVGLTLNANAQAPPAVEKSGLHSFQPILEERFASGNLHPAVKLISIPKPVHVDNPTAHGDAHGLSCLLCHGSLDRAEWDWKSMAGLQSTGRHGETGLILECESCHLKAVAIKS